MDSLESIFIDLFVFIEELVKGYDVPIEPTPSEIEEFKNKIIKAPSNCDPHLPKHFYLIERVAGDIVFSYNLDKYLGIEGDFDLMEFHSYIDDGSRSWDYLNDYLSWGKAAYMFFSHVGKIYDIHKFSLKVKLPMRFKDGNIYWVLQETRPFEIDSNKNMISHVNTYNIMGLYKEKSFVKINAELYYDSFYREDWNLMLAESRYAIKPFSISPVQYDILLHYHTNPDANTITCSNEIKYPRNTIKKYISNSKTNKGILDIARSSFPHITFNTIKDVVFFLEKIRWFNSIFIVGIKYK